MILKMVITVTSKATSPSQIHFSCFFLVTSMLIPYCMAKVLVDGRNLFCL